MKVPFTPLAQKLVVRKLMGMHEAGWDCNASLEKSAIYGYRGVFEVSKRETPKTEKDPALEKIERDKQICKPMPAAIREQIARMKASA